MHSESNEFEMIGPAQAGRRDRERQLLRIMRLEKENEKLRGASLKQKDEIARCRESIRELLVNPAADRHALTVFRTVTKCSERHACERLNILRTTVRYSPRRSKYEEANEGLRITMGQIAKAHPEWGYRRIFGQLKQDGWAVNAKRVYRIYTREKLGARHH